MPDKSFPGYKPLWPETAIIWGAGASYNLGLPTTDQIGQIISKLAGVSGDKKLLTASLDERFRAAFDSTDYVIHPELAKEFKDLLLLLFDGDGAKSDAEAHRILRDHVDKIGRKIAGREGIDDEDYILLEHYLLNIHHIYDWIGVRSIVKYMARTWDPETNKREAINYRDLLTTVDQLYYSDMAIPTEELFYPEEDPSDEIYLIDKHRLLGVKRCLMLLTATIQRVIIQKQPGKFSEKNIRPYWGIAKMLADLMEEESSAFYRRGYTPDTRKFYFFSYAFISFNWDPVMAWLIFKAHKMINDDKVYLGGNLLRLMNDSGDGIGIRKILDSHDSDEEDLLAFMMNEATCKKINDPEYLGGDKSRLVRVGKMLFPHAGLGWRICPRCGKLFTDFGTNLDDLYSTVSFGPDLLPGLNVAWKERTQKERDSSQEGAYGSIQCVFCGSITKPHDAPLMLQSAIKADRHYVLEGILRETGLVVGNARHLVFAGYSLPEDDYLYRCFFQSSMAGKNVSGGRPFCSLVDYDEKYMRLVTGQPWLEDIAIQRYVNSKKANQYVKGVVIRLIELFGLENIRVSLLGIPDIIVNHPEKNAKDALVDLLYPAKCFKEGFPIKR